MGRVNDRDDPEHVAWLLARERGQPEPALSAPDRARYTRLAALIADLPDTPIEPPEGWQQRMLAALEAAAEPGAAHAAAPAVSGPPRSERRRWGIAAAIAAAAAAIAIAVFLREPPSLEGPRIALVVEPGGANRGAQPGVGDTLVVRATLHGDGELRIYDEGGSEQARCAAPGPDCRIERERGQTTLVLRFPVRRPSTLRAVLFSPALQPTHNIDDARYARAPSPRSGMDFDVAAAVRANVTVTTREPVRFR